MIRISCRWRAWFRCCGSRSEAELAHDRLSVPTDKGSNAGVKVMALVAGMLAGADSIDDMNLLRHGGMGRLFDRTYAPSTLGSFLREFRFGHVRQLDAVASRVLTGLAGQAPLLQARAGERVMVDLDDTIIEVHGYQKQGASFGYSGVRGLNALLATASTSSSAPVVLGQRLRQGKTGSPKGAARIVGDALATLRRTGIGDGVRPLLRTDSAIASSAPTVASVTTATFFLRSKGRIAAPALSIRILGRAGHQIQVDRADDGDPHAAASRA